MSLQGCFAWRMSLEDPLGAPEQQASLSLKMVSESPQNLGELAPQHQLNPTLSRQLEQELQRILPRDRHVQVVGCSLIENCPENVYRLELRLSQAQQTLSSPPNFFGPPPGEPQIRMEMRLQGALSDAEGQIIRPIDLVQRGSGLVEAQQELEQQLLQRLRGRLIQRLQARYRYDWD